MIPLLKQFCYQVDTQRTQQQGGDTCNALKLVTGQLGQKSSL